MEYKTILIDLDGTIINSGKGIIESVRHTLEHYGIEDEKDENLWKFVGPPLVYSFGRYYGFPEEQCHEAVHIYRSFYVDKAMYKYEVYDGVEEMLSALKDSGYTVATATTKPEKFARKILEHAGLDKYFDYIAGAETDESRSQKWEVIEYVLEKCNCRDRKEAIIIGDRMFDIEGAKKTGISSMGILWGFGPREELEQAGADIILETPGDVIAYFKQI